MGNFRSQFTVFTLVLFFFSFFCFFSSNLSTLGRSKVHSIYFLQQKDEVGLIKIGRSSNIPRRLSELSVANPKPLKLLHSFECVSEKAAKHVEKTLHKTFCWSKTRGEWFTPSSQLRELIAALASGIPYSVAQDLAWKASKKKRYKTERFGRQGRWGWADPKKSSVKTPGPSHA